MTRVVFTGLGVVAPNGVGVEAYWSATLAGKCGIRPLRHLEPAPYPMRFGGLAEDFVAEEQIPGRLVAQTDRWTAMGLAAAEMAFADAGIDPATMPDYGIGVVTASSSGGNEFGQREIQALWSKGPHWVGTYQSIAWFYAATTGQVSIRSGARGPCGVLVSEQAAGLDAIGQARRVIAAGTPVVVTGGTEAPLSPYAMVCQLTSGRLSTATDPDRAYRPFDAAADGHVPGEGGAILIAEADDTGRAAGTGQARRYGRLAGYAATFDPPPGSGRPPGLRRAITSAIADAGLRPGDVDVVFADAAGVPELDRIEADALVEVFGRYGVPVAAPKTMTGRLYAGGASLDVATALLSIRDAVIPPAVNITDPGHPLDLVRDVPRKRPVRAALVVARGYGGFNAAVVVTAP